MYSPFIVPEGFARAKPCAGWSGKPNCLPTISSTRCSSARPQGPQEIGSMPGWPSFPWTSPLKKPGSPSPGIPAVLLFGIPRKKDLRGTEGYARNGVVQQAIRAIKKEIPGSW